MGAGGAHPYLRHCIIQYFLFFVGLFLWGATLLSALHPSVRKILDPPVSIFIEYRPWPDDVLGVTQTNCKVDKTKISKEVNKKCKKEN